MNVFNTLQTAGLRRTRAREVVLRLLLEVGRPLTHQELAVRPLANQLDRVTLYRTLAALVRAGLVHQVQGTDSSWRYCVHEIEQTECSGNHPHFMCLSCSKMHCKIELPLPWVSVPKGAQVVGKQFVVFGHCPDCAKDH